MKYSIVLIAITIFTVASGQTLGALPSQEAFAESLRLAVIDLSEDYAQATSHDMFDAVAYAREIRDGKPAPYADFFEGVLSYAKLYRTEPRADGRYLIASAAVVRVFAVGISAPEKNAVAKCVEELLWNTKTDLLLNEAERIVKGCAVARANGDKSPDLMMLMARFELSPESSADLLNEKDTSEAVRARLGDEQCQRHLAEMFDVAATYAEKARLARLLAYVNRPLTTKALVNGLTSDLYVVTYSCADPIQAVIISELAELYPKNPLFTTRVRLLNDKLVLLSMKGADPAISGWPGDRFSQATIQQIVDYYGDVSDWSRTELGIVFAAPLPPRLRVRIFKGFRPH